MDGCPAGLELSVEDMQVDLDRRRPGQSRYTTQRREADEVKILSGVFEGKTTGTPIGLLIENTDQRSKDYSEIKDRFRPAHADFTYWKKYGAQGLPGRWQVFRQRNCDASCGRCHSQEISLQLHAGVSIHGYLSQLGPIKVEKIELGIVNQQSVFLPGP